MGRTNKKGHPYLQNIEALLAMGINPQTGLPLKMSQSSCIKQNIIKQLRLDDQQCFVNRFYWHNLPRGLDSQDLERMLYYKGQICIFWNKTLNKFFATPFAPIGPIDYLGRPTTVKPVPFVDGNSQKEGGKVTNLSNWFASLNLRVLWDIPLTEELIEDPSMLENCCVIIQDYTPQISQTILPRQTINEGLIDIESLCIPYLTTSLLMSTGIRGMRVNNEDEAAQVYSASTSIQDAALNQAPFLPMVGQQEFQDFTNGSPANSEAFLLAMQSLDNIRMGALGLDNGGIFQKKAHELQAEAAMTGNNSSLILNDCLLQRQKRTHIMNALWGIPVSVSLSETVIKTDDNADGQLIQETDESNMN